MEEVQAAIAEDTKVPTVTLHGTKYFLWQEKMPQVCCKYCLWKQSADLSPQEMRSSKKFSDYQKCLITANTACRTHGRRCPNFKIYEKARLNVSLNKQSSSEGLTSDSEDGLPYVPIANIPKLPIPRKRSQKSSKMKKKGIQKAASKEVKIKKKKRKATMIAQKTSSDLFVDLVDSQDENDRNASSDSEDTESDIGKKPAAKPVKKKSPWKPAPKKEKYINTKKMGKKQAHRAVESEDGDSEDSDSEGDKKPAAKPGKEKPDKINTKKKGKKQARRVFDSEDGDSEDGDSEDSDPEGDKKPAAKPGKETKQKANKASQKKATASGQWRSNLVESDGIGDSEGSDSESHMAKGRKKILDKESRVEPSTKKAKKVMSDSEKASSIPLEGATSPGEHWERHVDNLFAQKKNYCATIKRMVAYLQEFGGAVPGKVTRASCLQALKEMNTPPHEKW